MLTLDKDNLIVRYAYHLSDKYRDGPPDTVSLCALFWRCVWPTVWYLGLTSFVMFTGYLFFVAPVVALARDGVAAHHADIVFFAIATALLVAGVVIMILFEHAYKKPESWLGVVFWGIKHHVCPVVQLKAVEPSRSAVARKSPRARKK